MSETWNEASSEAQRIEELEATVAAQKTTIDALIRRAERTQAGTTSTSFAIFNQNLELESVVNRKTARLRQALEDVERLHDELVDSTQALEEREQQLRLIVDAFPAPMCVLDEKLNILEVNGDWRDHSSGDESIYAGIDVGDSYFRLLQQEYRQLGSNLIEHIYTLNTEPDGTLNETVPFLRKGRTHWVGVRARRITSAGRQRLVVAHVDMTERIESSHAYKREQELLSLVLHNIPHGVYWKNKSGAYVGCNQAFADLVGCTESEMIGRGARATGPITNADIQEDFEVMLSGSPRLDQKRVVDAGSRRREFVYSKVPLLDPDGGSEGVLAIYADLTELTELERQLDQARRLEAIGQLSAGIAHEINTPMQYVGDNLHFITRASSLLLDLARALRDRSEQCSDTTAIELEQLLKNARTDALAERLPEAIESAKEGVAAVSKIVTAMKGFAHPGGTEMKRSSINEAIEATVAVARNEWKYCAELSLELEEGLPLVECDIAEINQVLLNMIVNAAHAVTERYEDQYAQGRISIRTRSRGETVAIEIEDDGTGIAPEHVDRVFEQFFTTKEVGKGTGQGLAISRSVIDRHNGRLHCKSHLGKGTTFTIELPLIQPDPEANE